MRVLRAGPYTAETGSLTTTVQPVSDEPAKATSSFPSPVQPDNALADAALAALQLPEEREVRDAAQRCGRRGADDDVALAVDDLHGVAEPQRPQRRPQLVETEDAGDDAGEPVRRGRTPAPRAR